MNHQNRKTCKQKTIFISNNGAIFRANTQICKQTTLSLLTKEQDARSRQKIQYVQKGDKIHTG